MPKTIAGQAVDPTVKFARLTIDGETYFLAFDFNSLAIAESVANVNLMSALRNLDNLSVGQTRGLLYAALLKAQPKMTIVAAGKLITLATIPMITESISEALRNSLPEETDENPPQPDAAPATN